MSGLIGALRVTLGIDTAAFEQGLHGAKTRMDGVRATMQAAGQAIGAALAGGAVLEGLSALRDMTHAAVDAAGAIGEQAQQLGVTTDALQEYRYAATQVGLSTEQMDNALAQLTRRTGQAAEGTGPVAEAFERLGISIRDSQGNIKSAGALIPEIAQAMRGLPSDAERAAVAVDLFGRAGQQLAPLLSGGAAGVNDLTSAAHELGVVLSSDAIAKADEVADQIAALNYQIEAQQNAKLLENADALLEFESALGDAKLALISAVGEFRGFAEKINLADTLRERLVGPVESTMAAVSALIDGRWTEIWAHATAAVNAMLPGMGAVLRTFVADQVKAVTDLATAIGNGLARGAQFFNAFGQQIAVWGNSVKASIAALSTDAVAYVRGLYEGVREFMTTRLNAVWDGVRAKIDVVKDAFFRLFDAVVGHSYIPDMVDGIGANMARLQTLMVDPAQRATATTGEAFRNLAADVAGVLDRLFPVQAQIRSILDDMATLEHGLAAGQIDRSTFAEAHRALAAERADLEAGAEEPIQVITLDERAWMASLQRMGEAAQTNLARPIADITAQVKDSFSEMLDSVSNSVMGIVKQIKSGDFLGALNSVVSVLAQSGLFGGGAQSGTPGGDLAGVISGIGSLFAGRANGGPVMANTPYLVGERRAELFVPSTSGRIEANPGGAGRAGMVVHNHYTLPSDEFWGRVDARADNVVMAAAPNIIRAGAAAGMAGMSHAQDRRLG